MRLINEMFGEPNDITCKLGVCLKKSYPHLEYVKIETDNTCTESIVENTAYIKNGLYIELYKNPNPSYHINTGDTSLCLVINESINSWVERYVNSMASTGYTGNLPSQIESRIIYDSIIGMYFKLSHTESSIICSGDTQPVWAIYDNLTDDVWVSGSTNNYWFTEGGFDKVDSLDINPNSLTFDNIMTVFKCVICELTLNIITQIAHTGNYDGTATAIPSGGTEPYTYLWSNNQTGQTATGLTGNTQYSVSVTDSRGCNITGSTIIDECNIFLTITGTSANGTSSDGTSTATPTNGTGPYTYLWSNSQTEQTATGLTGGLSYNVTVTDSLGCIMTGSTTIGVSCNLSLDLIITEPHGLLSEGIITAMPSGGTEPYTYLWSDSQTGQTATGLTGGNTYGIIVTDNVGCNINASILLNSACEISFIFTGETAHATAANGTLTAIPSGGTEPYAYSWNNSQTGQTITGLSGNTEYSVTITDGSGCIISGSTIVVECDCASGYTYNPTTDLCRTTTSATNEGTVFTAKHYQYIRYSIKGMIFYKTGNYNVDGTWDITKTDLLPDAYLVAANQSNLTNANNTPITNNLWVNPSQLSGVDNGRLNKTGVWVETGSAQNELGVFGFTQGFTVPTDDTYYVGFGSDNTGKIEIDGVTIVDQDIMNMAGSNYFNVFSPNEDHVPFWYWFMYPVQLTGGVTHNITISANNTGVLGILGCEIYNATEAELVACTTNSGAGVTSLSQYVVFSTAPKGTFAEKPLIGVNDGDQFQLGNWTCPVGYQLSFNGSYFCEKSESVVCP